MQIQIFHHPSVPMDLSSGLPKLGTISRSPPRLAEELRARCPHSASSQDSFHSGWSYPLSVGLWASLLHRPQIPHL